MIKPMTKPAISEIKLRKKNVAATGGVVPKIKPSANKITAGTAETSRGEATAPYFSVFSFIRSLRVTSYLFSNSFIFIDLLYKLCKLYSNYTHHKISVSS